MMTDNHFDARLKHIEEQYAARKEGAQAYRDQEMARLFTECHWTQDRIATKMNRSQFWVSQRLRLGRFLGFIAARYKDTNLVQNMTEWCFRWHWKQTTAKGEEEQQFIQIVGRLERGLAGPGGKKNKSHAGPKSPGGKHKATDDEVTDAYKAIDRLLQRWDSMSGIRSLISTWEDSRRWQFCDKLESLARTLRKLAVQCRHHSTRT